MNGNRLNLVSCAFVRLLLGGLLAVSFELGWAQVQSAPAQAQPPASDKQTGVRPGPTPEDWTSLSLAGSKLVPQAPVLGDNGDFPHFTRELLRVQWRLLDPIDLYVIRPKGAAKPPVVLYLYSYPSETDRFRDNSYCERLTEGGYAAVGFVSALTGQRYSMRPMKEWFVSELQESLVTSVHDVQMILNYLATRSDLDMDRVGMFGTGSGATIAILAAAADPRIKAIDLLNPWGDWPDWMAKSSLIPEDERPKYVKPEFLKKIAPFDPVQWLPQLKSQGVRIERLKYDTVTPQAAADRIEAAAGPAVKIVRYDDERQFYAAGSGGRIFQWVKDQLHPAAQNKPSSNSASTTESVTQPTAPGHAD